MTNENVIDVKSNVQAICIRPLDTILIKCQYNFK